MSWTNEDVRDEIYEQDEEEDEGPSWVDDKGKILEAAFCEYFLAKHPLMCLKQTLFDLDGEVDEDKLIYEIHQEIRYHARNDVAKKVKRLVEALKIEAYREEWKPQLDRIHLKNGTYYLEERGFVSDKELCLNRLPVEYQADAAPPVQWLKFLDELLIPEDIQTLQEYIGYLLIPSTKAQKMLILTGKGGEGKSRIGLVLKRLMGDAASNGSVQKVENNRFARADLERRLLMIDDDMDMNALPKTNYIKTIVTAEAKLDLERKGVQATQGLLYARLLCFGNGNLVAAHDTSDGFWRRQILISVKDKPEGRADDPYLIDKLLEELSGILLWALEGLKRLLANQYRFTLSERARQNLAAAMEDGCHLDQFMQASSYVRFDPERSARSTYLFRAYNKWCADNLEKPATQKKFSQYLFKNADRYGIRFSKHIEGGYRGYRGVYVRPDCALE